MRVDVLTVLPEMVEHALGFSIVGRAREAGLVDVRVVNLRDHAADRHRTTDDTPCGGGGGMIMKVDPVASALEAVTAGGPPARTILMDPQGGAFTQRVARDLAAEQHLVLVCGRYEGVDERIREHLVTEELSIGDYVLTGGELPALVVLDTVIRLLPGALGDAGAPERDSFADGLLEHPHYTRPRTFRGWEVPAILFSGNHARIERWRRWHQLTRTRDRRPDLWERYPLTEADRRLLAAGEPESPTVE